MAQRNCLIIQPCLIAGEHVEPGTKVTLDERHASNLFASKRGILHSQEAEAALKQKLKPGNSK